MRLKSLRAATFFLLLAAESVHAQAPLPAPPQAPAPRSGIAHNFITWLRHLAHTRAHHWATSSPPLPRPRPGELAPASVESTKAPAELAPASGEPGKAPAELAPTSAEPTKAPSELAPASAESNKAPAQLAPGPAEPSKASAPAPLND